ASGNVLAAFREDLRRLDLLGAGRAVRPGCADEVPKERVAGEGLGLQLRMELAAEEPGVVRVELDDLDELAVGRHAREGQASVFQRRQVLLVDLVTVTVAFGDRALTVGAGRDGAGGELARVLAQAHRAAERF